MKNLIKFLAIVLIIALTGLCFISCPESSGNGGSTTTPPPDDGSGGGGGGGGGGGSGGGGTNPLPPITPSPSSPLKVNVSTGGTSISFGTLKYGYTVPTAVEIIITNNTPDIIKVDEIRLNGGDGNFYDLSPDYDIAENDGVPGTKSIRNYLTFKVSPVSGLPVRKNPTSNYGDAIIISYPGAEILSQIPLNFIVEKADGADVASAISGYDAKDDTSITIISSSVTHSITGQKLEYTISTSSTSIPTNASWGEDGWDYNNALVTDKWDKGPSPSHAGTIKFTGLEQNTDYFFFVRYKDDDQNYKAGLPYAFPLRVTTDKTP